MSAIEIPDDSPFGLDNLPYGIFTPPAKGAMPRMGIRVADSVVDLAMLLDEPAFEARSLNPFMARGPEHWASVRSEIQEVLDCGYVPAEAVHPVDDVTLSLPFEVADYVDFYASEYHAYNVGRIFRPDAPPLMPNWKHLPVGYHGRAGTVVASGTNIVRPSGQRKLPGEAPTFGPSVRLDIEADRPW